MESDSSDTILQKNQEYLGRQSIDQLILGFFRACDRFSCNSRIPAVKTSSGYDPSVRFIGSHISVMVPIMAHQQIPKGGAAMWQDCVRTRCLAEMLQTGELSAAWGSYFVSIGALLPPGEYDQAALILFDFLIEQLALDPADVNVSFYAYDNALKKVVEDHFATCDINNSTEQKPFRHKVGIESIKGKNINIAIRRDKGSAFEPIANLICYQDKGRPCGIELAVGTSTVAKVQYGLNHVLDTFPLPTLDETRNNRHLCLKDSAVTALHLLREGLKPTSSRNVNRLLRKYLNVFRHAVDANGVNHAILADCLRLHLSDFYNSQFALERARDVNEVVGDLMRGVLNDDR